MAPPPSEAFSHIETWLFDLDNTLYSARYDLFPQVERRIGEFVSRELGITREEARRIQKTYFREHGSTMRGMMTTHGTDPHAFLALTLGRLPGRKFIYTNASTAHAERVMDQLGVSTHFDGIFDIHAADFLPKPHIDGFETLLSRFAINATRAAFFEDIARNLVPAAQLGMTTVWVPGSSDHAAEGADSDHVHFVVEDLETWLRELSELLSQTP
jgi:putative hydrolase of the HAD superfamily